MADVEIVQYMTLIPAAPQPDYLAELFYGLNGDAWGPNELVAGTPDNLQGTHVIWDENPDDGVDSGWCSIAMFLRPGVTGLQFGVDQMCVPTSSVADSVEISHIDILATVQTQAAIEWSSVTVGFYKDGVHVDEACFAGLEVDQTNGTGTISQQLARITPTVTGCDQVMITGRVRLTAPEGTYPAEDGIFSQIMIYTA